MQGRRLVVLLVVLLSIVIAIPSAMAAEDWTTKVCWKTNYKLGSTTSPICEQNQELVLDLCYITCKSGFKGVGPICSQICPEGYIDEGATCRKGTTVVKKESYGRGVGKVPHVCPPFHKYEYGSCKLTSCKLGDKAIGDVCWQVCNITTSARGISMPADCGRACSSSEKSCAAWRGALSKQGFKSLANTVNIFDSKLDSSFSAERIKYPVQISDCHRVIPHKSVPRPR